MTINFPNSPALNEEYTYGGFTYVYDGEKWTSKATTNTAFVKTTGDTMSGGLTIKPPSSGQLEFSGTADHSQVSFHRVDGTPAHIFRYVETGDSITGLARNLDGSLLREWISHEYSTDKTRISGPSSSTVQGTDGFSLTRKDYVDGSFVKKSGDTMTSDLIIQKVNTPGIMIQSATPQPVIRHLNADGSIASGYFHDTATNKTHFDEYVDGAWTRIWMEHDGGTGVTSIYKPISSVSQQPEGAALTRKDYVDGKFLGSQDVVHGSTLDWNTLTSQGVYQYGAEGNTFGPNGPSGIYGYGQIVVTAAQNTIVQIYYPHSSPMKIAMRFLFGTAWVPWTYFQGTATTTELDRINELEARIAALEGGV